ncbi:MAG: hypothetical protein PUB32_02860 [Clostridiales bacterium]|nr:hypothetical protein [Clostridiales bacterium]
MKKSLALILALVLVVAMLAGCAPANKVDDNKPSPTPGSVNTSDSNTGDTDTEPVDEGPYHMAYGKFEFNADGYVDEAFEYTLPLSTTDEVFTYWTTCWTPQHIPEGGLQELETLANIEELTGVHIEYEAVSAENRAQNFAVLLAADDLRDIMDQAIYFYTGSPRSIIDDGWVINFYDYREYMPNYLFNLWDRHDIDVLKYGRLDDTTWPAMYGLLIDPAPGSGYMLRQDIMDDLNLGAAADVKTFDQWHDVLTAFKNNGVKWPLALYKTVELTAGSSFSGYNTAALVSETALPAAKVIDGKVQYSLTTQDDRDLVTMINQWYKEGLIDPNYTSNGDNTQMSNSITTGELGCIIFNPSEVAAWEATCSDPDAKFMPTPRIKKTEDQILQYGQKQSNFHMGSACVSANCENIPLVCTWLDWKWSPYGIEVDNWGVEGLTYVVNENGEKQLSDFVLNNPDGLGAAWVMVLYTCDGLRQPCMNMHRRMYAYPGGEIFLQMFDTWTVDNYGGEYDFPTGVTYTDDQSEELNKYSNDIITYIGENYYAFIDGSKPISEWDSYVAQLENLGIDKCREIVQEAYEAYIA